MQKIKIPICLKVKSPLIVLKKPIKILMWLLRILLKKVRGGSILQKKSVWVVVGVGVGWVLKKKMGGPPPPPPPCPTAQEPTFFCLGGGFNKIVLIVVNTLPLRSPLIKSNFQNVFYEIIKSILLNSII